MLLRLWSIYKPRRFIAVNVEMVHFWTMTRADAQMKIRLPDSLRLQIEQAAQASGRSLNAEIVRRLEVSFNQVSIDPIEYENLKIHQPDFLQDKIDDMVKESINRQILEGLKRAGVKSLFDEPDNTSTDSASHHPKEASKSDAVSGRLETRRSAPPRK